jgi:hypothetical protein
MGDTTAGSSTTSPDSGSSQSILPAYFQVRIHAFVAVQATATLRIE